MFRLEVANAVEGCDAAPPEITVERDPSSFLEGMTQMALQAPDRCFRLRLGVRDVVGGGISRVEPNTSVAVKDPVSPALGISQFRLESPAIDSPINELGGIVLSRGRYDLDSLTRFHRPLCSKEHVELIPSDYNTQRLMDRNCDRTACSRQPAACDLLHSQMLGYPLPSRFEETNMSCRSCGSGTQKAFASEISVHILGLENVDKPAVMVFPRLLVCMDCGFTELAMTENELRMLGKDPASYVKGAGSPIKQG